ncbi:MAG TPA: O-antigen ligase family protein [Chthoniobacterales bacterium]|nr:O-antigen ligase family protein [Chthoniobacterales bacterium]
MGVVSRKPKIPPRRKPTPEFTWEDLATAMVPVLACFLGGATEKWAEGLVVAFVGLLLVVNPPRFSLGRAVNLILLGLLACAALAFLPASWFAQPAWRAALINDFGIALPPTVSPQPWVTTGCSVSFAAGLCWLYYASGHEAEMRAARRELRLFAGGVVVLAGLAIALYLAHRALPFWKNQRGFGCFPNRNQTANLLGLTSLVVVACGYESIRRKKITWICWAAGLVILLAALVLNFSRAGILLLVAGNALWLAVLILRSGSRVKIAVGLSTLLLLLTALLVFGGPTLARFDLQGGAASRLTSDFRWLIFSDTWKLIAASPWCGIGLGNFDPVFAIFREASAGQNRALHPESDWLWLAAEVGWPGVLLVLVGAALLLVRVFPFVEGTNQWFRTAAVIAALLFGLHGLVDVSGHRVGTAYAGLFLLGLALRRPLPQSASVALMRTFRTFGALLFVVGMIWLLASYRGMTLPGSIGVDVQRQRATSANVGRQHSATIEHATRGLQWAPLDWSLYFLRALGKVGANRPAEEAAEDFRRARFLEPNSYEVPYQEGMAWMAKDAVRTMTAWREALRRAGPERPQLYDRMLSAAAQMNRRVQGMLEAFGATQPDLALTYLERASGDYFNAALDRLLESDPSLGSLSLEQKRKLFSLWSERGDLVRLASLLEQWPELLELGWRGLARHRAASGDFAEALRLTKQFGQKPALPPVPQGVSLEHLEKTALAHPNDYATGFAVFQQQMQQNRVDDALVTVRRYTERPAAPAYFYFLEAEAWAAKGNWERAWAAWEKFEARL